MLVTSSLLDAIAGLRHGFSTRNGGVSVGPYASLNLGLDVGVAERVHENRRRFAHAIGFEGSVVQVDQVHGTDVVHADDVSGPADGLIVDRPGVAVGIRTADCAPVLIAATSGGAVRGVAAVHAGWRGATAGILARAIEAFEARSMVRGDLTFAIGPTISAEHFEVGLEVIEAARDSIGGDEPPTQDGVRGRPHLDLVELLVMQLKRAGIDPERIDRVGGCTYGSPSTFFSHRRDRGITGRHLSAIHFDAP